MVVENSRAGLRKKVAVVVLVSISALLLLLTARTIQWPEFKAALAGVRVHILALSLVALAAGYLLRITRWWLMLRTECPGVRWRECAAALLTGFAANNVLPFRMGDVYRCFSVSAKAGRKLPAVVASVAAERIFDLTALVFFLWCGLLALPQALTETMAAQAATRLLPLAAGSLLAFLLVPGLALKIAALPVSARIAARLPGGHALRATAIAFCQAMLGIGRLSSMPAFLGLTVAAWGCEAFVYLAAAASLGITLSPAGALASMSAANFAMLIPSSPGAIGSFEYSLSTILGLLGVDASRAAAAAVVCHAALWIPVTGAGAVAILYTGKPTPEFKEAGLGRADLIVTETAGS